MSVNKVILLGSVGKDPEVRIVGEAKVATFSVATNEKYKDSKSGERKDYRWGCKSFLCCGKGV